MEKAPNNAVGGCNPKHDDSDDENADFTQKIITEAETQDEIDDIFKEKKKIAIENLTDEYSNVMDKINKNYYEEKFKQ